MGAESAPFWGSFNPDTDLFLELYIYGYEFQDFFAIISKIDFFFWSQNSPNLCYIWLQKLPTWSTFHICKICPQLESLCQRDGSCLSLLAPFRLFLKTTWRNLTMHKTFACCILRNVPFQIMTYISKYQ